MTKKRVFIFGITTVFLIFVDQISKVFIKAFFICDSKKTFLNILHIHPRINSEGVDFANEITKYLDIDINVILILRALFFIIILAIIVFVCTFLYMFFFWGCNTKMYMPLNIAILSFGTSSVLCSVLMDELFFGGSLDWICIFWSGKKLVNNHYHLIERHLTVDFKDIYIFITIILLILRYLLGIYTLLKSTSEERKIYDFRAKHPIKNVKEMITYIRKKGSLNFYEK